MPGAPNPATAGQNVPGQASPLQLAYLWLKADGPVSQVSTAVSVALAESSGKITARNQNTNGTTDHGLWQINDVNLGTGGAASPYASNIINPLNNAKAAVAVYKSQGWGGWSTYNNGAYKTYFNQGITAANVATASTADQIAGALLPLAGIAGGAALGGEAAAGEASTAGGLASGLGSTIAKGAAGLGVGAELASIWSDIKGNAIYGLVTVALILVGVFLITRSFTGGGSASKVKVIPV
jgi:hypothetical protein